MASTARIIKGFIIETFAPSGDVRVSGSTSLIEDEIVDSVGILSLVSFIEARFGIEVDDAEVNLDNFDSIRSIARLVDAKRSG